MLGKVAIQYLTPLHLLAVVKVLVDKWVVEMALLVDQAAVVIQTEQAVQVILQQHHHRKEIMAEMVLDQHKLVVAVEEQVL
jgi:hypothetical protein